MGAGSFLLLLFTYWNTSVASTAAILLHEETKNAFNKLSSVLTNDFSLLRKDVAEIANLSKEQKEKTMEQLEIIKKELLTIINPNQQNNNSNSNHSSSSSSSSFPSSALSSIARAVGWKNKYEDSSPSSSSSSSSSFSKNSQFINENEDSGGTRYSSNNQEIWEDGFLAGLHAQIINDKLINEFQADLTTIQGKKPTQINTVPGVHSQPPAVSSPLSKDSEKKRDGSSILVPDISSSAGSASDIDSDSPAADHPPVDTRYQGAITAPPSKTMGKPPLHKAGRDD